jgi:hypothetical protein
MLTRRPQGGITLAEGRACARGPEQGRSVLAYYVKDFITHETRRLKARFLEGTKSYLTGMVRSELREIARRVFPGMSPTNEQVWP